MKMRRKVSVNYKEHTWGDLTDRGRADVTSCHAPLRPHRCAPHYHTPLYNTTLNSSTPLCTTLPHSTVQLRSTTLYHTPPHSTTLHTSTPPCTAIHHSIPLYSALLCSASPKHRREKPVSPSTQKTLSFSFILRMVGERSVAPTLAPWKSGEEICVT